MTNETREILGNAKMAYTTMGLDIDGKKVVQSILDIIEEDKTGIKEANGIDVKNNNGFLLDFEIFEMIKEDVKNLDDSYRKVIKMRKEEGDYLRGIQTDNLGTICLVYDGNTYCMLELILKCILTHNSLIIASEKDYMKGTNELILILVRRILKSYNIDTNLIQILYTDDLNYLLENNISINKVVAIGNRDFQNRIRNISKIDTICKGYGNYELYIEDLTNLSFIEKIINENSNIDVYVKNGLKVPFDDYIDVQDIDEAIAQINFQTSGYSSSIFTNDGKNASEFLRNVKTEYLSVNSSPLIKEPLNLGLDELFMEKRMFYPSPFSKESEKNKLKFSTESRKSNFGK